MTRGWAEKQRLGDLPAYAKAEGSDLVEALQTGVDKTRAKLEAAEKALQAYQQAQAPEGQNKCSMLIHLSACLWVTIIGVTANILCPMNNAIVAA